MYITKRQVGITILRMSFAEWLSKKIEDHRMSQTELAQRLGLTRGAVNNLLSGRSKNPSAETMQKLADIFHVPADELYRIVGILPTKSKRDALEEEANYLFSKLKDKQTALNLLRALPRDDDEKKTIRTGSNSSQATSR